jgi:threonyl-tRNA synthetase
MMIFRTCFTSSETLIESAFVRPRKVRLAPHFFFAQRSAMPDIKLPDGSIRSYEQAVTVAEVAASIGAGLARAALAGKVDGKMVDTSYLIEQNVDLAIITERDAEGLEIIRHSTAHLLAYAVKELFPEAQVTIGPVIENGFYYDFAYKRPFTPEDLVAIEKRMAELAKKDIPVSREVWARDDAVKFFLDAGEKYKAELIAAIPGRPAGLAVPRR